MTQLPEKTDVLIVGLGPVGAALANLLGSYRVNTVVIDKAEELFLAPRAIALDNEALRILQMCGINDKDIDTVPIPEVRMYSRHFGQYSRAITGGSIDGHPKLVTFYQPQLEQVLRGQLDYAPNVTVMLGAELQGFQQGDESVEATIRDKTGAERRISASYMVGADGANSLVRRLLGLDFKGKTYAEDWLVVDAKKVDKTIDHVEFICDPARPTPHMVAPGGRQRWEFKLQPGETREQMEHPDTVRKLLSPWTNGTEPDIERVAVYRFHARVADTFQMGRAFLVGDAAHITPPFVGQGLVAGLRDIANLAWKLAWVIQGRAQPSLLKSYDQERRPHATNMIKLAKLMGRLVMPTNSVAAFLTHGLMKIVSKTPKVNRLVEQLEIKPANRFKHGFFVSKDASPYLPRGGQVPQVWVRSALNDEVILSDDALGAGFALVGFGVDPRSHLAMADVLKWRASGGTFVQINPRGTWAAKKDIDIWEDLSGSLIPAVVPFGWLAVVRPDKTVMHDGPFENAQSMLNECLCMMASQTKSGGGAKAQALAA